MVMDGGVLALVLLAALLHATWNALVKSGGDLLVVQTIIIVTPGFYALLLLPFVPLPGPASWPYLAASVVIHLVYYVTLVFAYRHGDLSQVYPIARGAAPALVAALAWPLAGEALTLLEILGLLVVSAGIISLAWRRGLPREGETKAIGFALATACMIGLYSVADGLGVRHSGSALGYIVWLFFLEAFPLLLLAAWRRRGALRKSFAPHLRRGVAGGTIAALAYGIVIWGLSVAPMAHVVALRETSVIIAALIGSRLLAEPFGRYRIAASAVVAAGTLLLNIGH